jgi:DNA repair protein RadD
LSQHPVDAYLEHCNGERCVVFTQGIKEADQWAEEALSRGIPARSAHSQKKTKERADTLAAFAAGDVKLIFNPMILTEGWDCPACSNVMIARGCESMATFLQMVGRGLRPSKKQALPGERAKLIDLRGWSWAHGLPDEDREYSLDGKAMKRKSDCWRCPAPCGALNDKKAKECALCKEPKPVSQGMKPQEIERARLKEADKAEQANAWKLRMRSWKALLSRFAYDQAAMMYRIEWGQQVPKTFPKVLKRAA